MNKFQKKSNISKDILKKIKLYIPAQNATSLTNLNATLGQAGLNAFEFSKEFNKSSDFYLLDVVLNIEIKIFIDKTYEIIIKSPTTSFILVEQCLLYNNILEYNENTLFINNIGLKEIYKIAYFLKKNLFITLTIHSIFCSLLGTIKSMNLKIINDLNIKK
jgi:large subunit ribosomal protein L11